METIKRYWEIYFITVTLNNSFGEVENLASFTANNSAYNQSEIDS